MTDFEQKQKIISIGQDLPAELAKLEAEGWKVIPGITPIVIYSLFREIPVAPIVAASMVVESNLIIDDTKVHVVRNGKIVG